MKRQWQLTINFPTQELRTAYLKEQDALYDFCFEERLLINEWKQIQYRIPRDQPQFLDWEDSEGVVWDSEQDL